MQNITVNKADLIAKLRTNRDEHKAIYDEAVSVYKERFIREAEKFLMESLEYAKRGEPFKQMVWLPVPEEHTADFDRALEMLEWEVDDEVELSEYEFSQLVQNEWGWAKNFASNTTSYTAGR